jgi:hypothetical protein
VGYVLGVVAVARGVAALLQAGPVLRGVSGQEPGEAGELDDGEQPARGERVMDLARRMVGIGHVVHGGRCPHQLRLAEVRPRRVEVSLDGAHTVGNPTLAGLFRRRCRWSTEESTAVMYAAGEACEQGKGAGTGPAAQIHDLSRARLDGQPRSDRCKVLREDFFVEVEDFRLAVDVAPVSVLVYVLRAVVAR